MTDVTEDGTAPGDLRAESAPRVTNPWRPGDQGPWAAEHRRPVRSNPWLPLD